MYLKNRIYITAFVFYLYIHCWDSLYLNWCWVDDSLLFQTFQNCCRKNKQICCQLMITVNHESVFLCWAESAVTWWKLHLSEAFDRSWNAVAINQDVKFLPDALMSGVWHIQDVAWCFPAIQYIWDERILKKKLQRETDYMEFCDKELTLFL